jgi:hypothetical protein
LFHFEGRVLDNNVIDVDNMPVTSQEWWGGRTRTYYIHRVTERMVHYTSFTGTSIYNWNGSSRRNTWDTSATLHRLTGPPSELETSGLAAAAVQVGSLYNQVAEYDGTVNRLTVENNDLRTQVRNHGRKPDQVRQYVTNIRHNLDAIAQLLEE